MPLGGYLLVAYFESGSGLLASTYFLVLAFHHSAVGVAELL